jgi:hypothetical protein
MRCVYVSALTVASQLKLVEFANSRLDTVQVDGEPVPAYRTRQRIWGQERTVVVIVSERLREGQARGPPGWRRKARRPTGKFTIPADAFVGERAPGTSGTNQAGQLSEIQIDREVQLDVDRATLPPDAQDKGYQAVVVQELRIATENVRFLRTKYYSKSQSKTYLAPLPEGYSGEYGPNVKTLCVMFAHLCHMSEPKIGESFANMGIRISAGQISHLLTEGHETFHQEKEEIVEAGLNSSPWQHIDDTGTRVDGVNWHCQVLCNPLYTAYFTTERKDRLTVIDVLRKVLRTGWN